jgi:hypothetical protein
MEHDITVQMIWTTTTFDGYPLQFRWNMSKTINIFTGLIDDDGDFIDAVEVDIISLSTDGDRATLTEANKAVKEWLTSREVIATQIA